MSAYSSTHPANDMNLFAPKVHYHFGYPATRDVNRNLMYSLISANYEIENYGSLFVTESEIMLNM